MNQRKLLPPDLDLEIARECDGRIGTPQTTVDAIRDQKRKSALEAWATPAK